MRRADGAEHVITFTAREVGIAPAGDALLAATLLPAMRLHEELEVADEVSPRLLGASDTIQDIWTSWAHHVHPADPPFARVPLRARTRDAPLFDAPRGRACFFTAGVDSFYTALARRSELDALVFVHGFDVALDDPVRDRVADGVRKAAAALGLPLVEVETDIRAFSDELLSWPDYHGSALASVALLLAPAFETIYLPATMTYALLDPLGSHPLLDPLWSTEDVEVVHEGLGATRIEKLAAITEEPAARRWLRVCYRNHGGAYNCGRCEKCVRTMVALRIAGLADRVESLPPLRLSQVATVRVPGQGSMWRSYAELLQATGRDPALRRAIQAALLGRHARRVARRLRAVAAP